MINILLHGAGGRMGRAIADIVKAKENMRVICGVDIAATGEFDFPVFTDFSDVPEDTEIDVIIDFSHFTAVPGVVSFAKKRGIPAVIATTGLSEEQLADVKALSSRVAVFRSANMSVGISLLKQLVCEAADFLGDGFDIEIVERHHNQKLDAPSGTALAIADAINDTLSEPAEYVYDRHSVRRKRRKTEIGISAVRGGTIVGDHEIIFAGNDEVIELNHHAASKEVFAVGAIKAAKFIVGKTAGMYAMNDLFSDI